MMLLLCRRGEKCIKTFPFLPFSYLTFDGEINNIKVYQMSEQLRRRKYGKFIGHIQM